jgi:hypothetical protein
MTPEHQKIKEYLQHLHRGRSKIVSAKAMAGALNIAERKIRDIVRDLRRAHRCPIGSSMGRPSGYYWAVSPEELAETIRPLRALSTDMLATLSAMERCFIKLGGQMELLEEPK